MASTRKPYFSELLIMGRQNRDKDTVGKRLIAIVAAALRVPTSRLTLETGPGDLEAWDSLGPGQRRVRRSRPSSGSRFLLSRWQRSDHPRFLDYIEKTP
jgi:hypothetical protein